VKDEEAMRTVGSLRPSEESRPADSAERVDEGASGSRQPMAVRTSLGDFS
jgi:hypothetical protein